MSYPVFASGFSWTRKNEYLHKGSAASVVKAVGALCGWLGEGRVFSSFRGWRVCFDKADIAVLMRLDVHMV